MEKTTGAIPAFYACYLLRSVVRHSSLYVGSTPNPVRRLRQHNGEAKGGAVRTSKDSLRPWEMTCLVTGFPSKIAALQFEWAWQNPGVTRHVAPDMRITQAKMTTRISPRTGKLRKRSAKPRMSLTDRIANLHLLLQTNSFKRWPLSLTFFSADVFRVWQRWITQHPRKLQITAVLDNMSTATDHALRPSGIQALDVTYATSKSHLLQSLDVFSAASSAKSCSVCRDRVSPTGAGALVCPHETCAAVTHLQCLSTSFLMEERAQDTDAVVPVAGLCPGCHSELRWSDLVKDLSIRMRGDKVIAALTKPKRGQKANKDVTSGLVRAETSDEEDLPPPSEDESHILAESSEGESVTEALGHGSSHARPSTIFMRSAASTGISERIIEDSDWDEAEIIT